MQDLEARITHVNAPTIGAAVQMHLRGRKEAEPLHSYPASCNTTQAGGSIAFMSIRFRKHTLAV